MRVRFSCISAFYALTACASTTSGVSADEAVPTWGEALGADISEPWMAGEYRDFDFWIGEWEATWRRRPQDEFHVAKEGNKTRQRIFPILSGKALVELAWARDNPEDASQRGFSIRYFDPARQRWIMAQNWPGPNNQGAAFTDQLIGDEHLGRLSMYSVTKRRNQEGEIVSEHRRYNFTDIRPGVSFRWDGSNTPDRGATWFTWNVVDFLRLRDLDAYGPAGMPFPGVHGKNLCTEEPHGAFDGLTGVWEGEAVNGAGEAATAMFSAGLALDGCGLIGVIDAHNVKTLVAAGYHQRFEKWVIYQLDNQPGTAHRYFVSGDAGAGAEFVEAADLAIKDEFTAYNEQAHYEPEAPLSRLVWSVVTDEEVQFRIESRASSAAEWSADVRYYLRRR